MAGENLRITEEPPLSMYFIFGSAALTLKKSSPPQRFVMRARQGFRGLGFRLGIWVEGG